MDYREDQTIVDFRNEVKTFIGDNLPSDWGSGSGGEGYEQDVMDLTRSFQSEMAKRRWLTMAWPREHGGLEAPHSQQMIMAEEMAYHRAPGGGSNMGVQWVGPSLMLYGTDEQKEEHLAGIADAETWWCTLYSEPGSGSDPRLAADPRVQGRRRLRDQRPEDLDLRRARLRLGLARRSHRPGRAEAQGHHDVHDAHGHARRHGASA